MPTSTAPARTGATSAHTAYTAHTPDTDAGAPAASGRRWAIVASLFLFMLINFADKAVLGLVAIPLMHDMQLTHAQFGLVGSAFFLLFSISGIGIGLIADRVNLKWLLAALALTWAVAQLPLAWPASFAVLLLCRVLLGAGEGPASPLALHVVYTWFDDRERNLPTAIVQQGATAGVIVAGPVLTMISERWHWHATFLTLGAVGIAWTLVWLCVGKTGERHRAAVGGAAAGCGADRGAAGVSAGAADRGAAGVSAGAADRGAAGVSAGVSAGGAAGARPDATLDRVSLRDAQPLRYRTLLGDRTIVGMMLQCFVGYAVIAVGFTWVPAYFRLGLGFPATQAGWLFALQVAAQIPLGIALALFSHRLLKRGVPSRIARGKLISGACVVGGFAYCALLLGAPPFVKIALLALASGLAIQTFTFGPMLVAEVVPAARRGALLAITNSLVTTAGLIGPAAMGRLLGANSGARGYEMGFAVTGVLLMAAGVAGWMLIDPQRSKQRLEGLRA